MGDRIQCSISSESVSIYHSLVKENRIYSLHNFIVKPVGKGLRVTCHKFKLRFFGRMCVSLLSSEEFPFSPFHFTPYPKINDCVGQVVEREDPEDIITKAGQSSKRMRIYLEDE
ncbi:hypothetical protein PIB30_072872 [Stylosanthes scabra]|uniref:Replication protein A 70 kDa DNA-binding subunit B/D first OB fold domain-containing protein n=1 Tax=Stylosanthes scabra TaxID=79078 RepID=A0ABU6TNW1_9FABA|nr:hypothetical protein [Stylosanthes scabra]MED6150497.1 hypothetical protein [Stylosanthes scabra]